MTHYPFSFRPQDSSDIVGCQTLLALADHIVREARDWKDLRAEKAMRTTASGSLPCWRITAQSTGDVLGHAFMPPDLTINDLTAAVRHKGQQLDGPASGSVVAITPLAAFNDLLKRHSRRGRAFQLLGRVQVRAQVMDGVGLVCQVEAMPAGHFNEAALLIGPGFERPILSATGEQAFNLLHTLGRQAVGKHMAKGAVFALILTDRALDAARAAVSRPEAA